MEHFSLFDFLTVSIPEEFSMVMLAWIVLGKKSCIKFRSVIAAALLSAISFVVIKTFFSGVFDLYAILQFVSFCVVIFFVYRLNYIETVVGGLFTAIFITVLQYIIFSIAYLVSGLDYNILANTPTYRLAISILEYSLIIFMTCILYRKDIKVFNIKSKNIVDSYYNYKIRYLALQLTFAGVIILLNYKIMYSNSEIFNNIENRIVMGVDILVIVVFTVLILRSAIKMSLSVQREENLKRKFDSWEIMQNIDYVKNLVSMKEYDEVNKVLDTIKDDVGGLVSNIKI